MMLSDIKKEFYEQIASSINKYKFLGDEIARLEEEIKKLEDEENELTTFISNYKRPPRPSDKYNIFQKVFLSKKRKDADFAKYREEISDYREATNKKGDIALKKTEIKNQISRNKFEQESINLNALNNQKEMLEQMTDEQFILYAVNERPELCSNVDFMREITTVNYKYIIYDKTDDVSLYIDMLEKMKNNPELLQKYGNSSFQNISEMINNIIQELKSPKEVPSDKYKVPAKYLLESIREDIKDEKPFSNCSFMFNIDGYYDKQTGEQLENSYNSQEYSLFIHRELHQEDDKSAEVKKLNSICKEGLQTTLHEDTDSFNDLGGTTFGTIHKGVTFLGLIGKKFPQIIIMIPKERISTNTRIWASNEPVATVEKPTHLLPEYVVGYIIDGKFVPNPYKLEEREKYTYYYGNREKVSRDSEQVR